MIDLFVFVFAFLAGTGLGTFVLGTKINNLVSDAVAQVHKDYAEVESKTKTLIVAGVTRVEEIKKVL